MATIAESMQTKIQKIQTFALQAAFTRSALIAISKISNSANSIKKSILTRLVPNKKKQCSIRMLVGLHTHYQMHLASKFTLFFFMKFDPTQAFYLQIQSIFIKTNTFYKKLPRFIKNCIGPPYKKTQTSEISLYKKLKF